MNFMQYSAGVALSVALLRSLASVASAEIVSFEAKFREPAASIEQKVIAWQRDIHQHPELGGSGK
jgi:hypothetical protein